MRLEISSMCETGLVRRINQDSILVYQRPSQDFALFAVADGMGGYADGEKASALITSALREWLDGESVLSGPAGTTAVFTGLDAKLRETSAYIHAELNRDQLCGSTCVLLFFQGEICGVLSVGDSRLYRCRGFSCEPLTKDDVWENLSSVRNSRTPAQIREDPNYGKLTQAIGIREAPACSMSTDRARGGDLFALCSDGVYKSFPESRFRRLLFAAKRQDLDAARDRIRREVLDAGARDNFSLILARYHA